MKISLTRQVILCWTISIFTYAVSAENAPRVEVLRPSEVKSECGCSFQMAGNGSKYSDATFLQWDIEDNGSMRVDGRLIKLKASHVESKMKSSMPSVGDVDTFRLKGDHVDVLVSCTAIQVCSPEDDSCESTGYKAKVTVKSPRGSNTLNATGACGC